jgi:hypothetical protein
MNVKKIVFIMWAVTLMMTISPVQSATVLTSHVSVESNGVANERDVLEEALADVIVTLTGDEATRNSQITENLKKRLDEFLVEYRYEPSGQEWDLVAKFDQEGLSQVVDKEGVVTHKVTEEEVLLWLVYQYPERMPVIVNTGSPEKLKGTLVKSLRSKGLQPLLPIMDLDDQQKVDPADILAGKDSSLVKASQRYGVTHYITGVLQFDAGHWKTTLRSDRNPESVSSHAGILGGAFSSALTLLQSSEQENGGLDSAYADRILIQVDYIGSYRDYKRLTKFFDASEQINQWMVQLNRGESTLIELDLSVSAKQWLKILNRGSILEHVAAPVGAVNDDVFYYFTLNSRS